MHSSLAAARSAAASWTRPAPLSWAVGKRSRQHLLHSSATARAPAASAAATAGPDAVSSSSPAASISTLRPKRSLKLSSGVELPASALRIKYSVLGNPDGRKVLLCPSMSNSVHAVDGVDPDDGARHRGWWRSVVGHGPEFGIDLDQFQVIIGAPLGSPFGSTSPLTDRGDGSGPLRAAFPQITPRDQALHQKLLLEELGIDRVFAVVGGSMGGMQALQFAANFPSAYERFVAIAATAHTSPGTVALRSVQRHAVRMDPDFADGAYVENPKRGMGLARMFGTICYRSPTEFDARFDWSPVLMETGETRFEVEMYLQHQAHTFTHRVNYDANCYLLLSQSMDLMDIGQGVGDFQAGAARIPADAEGLLLSYSTDRLTPAQDLEKLARVLGARDVPVHFETIASTFGHDAFLVESEAGALNVRLGAFLLEPGHGKGVHSVRRVVKDLFEH